MSLEQMLQEIVGEVRVMCLCQQRNVPVENGCALYEGDGYRIVQVRRDGSVSISRGIYEPSEWKKL